VLDFHVYGNVKSSVCLFTNAPFRWQSTCCVWFHIICTREAEHTIHLSAFDSPLRFKMMFCKCIPCNTVFPIIDRCSVQYYLCSFPIPKSAAPPPKPWIRRSFLCYR